MGPASEIYIRRSELQRFIGDYSHNLRLLFLPYNYVEIAILIYFIQNFHQIVNLSTASSDWWRANSLGDIPVIINYPLEGDNALK